MPATPTTEAPATEPAPPTAPAAVPELAPAPADPAPAKTPAPPTTPKPAPPAPAATVPPPAAARAPAPPTAAIRALATRKLDTPAPAGAGALRFSVFGDRSGARVQARLLALGAGQDVGAYFGARPITIDFAGWKTVTVPLAEFAFRSEQNLNAPAPALSAADNVQFAVTGTAAKIFIDDVGWTTAGAAPADPALAAIDNFDAGPIAWSASGNYDQVSTLSLNVNRLPAFVRSAPASLQIVVRARSAAEKQLHAPALLTRLKTAPIPYVVYLRPPFDPILPESAPAPSELPKQLTLSAFACAEETEPMTFAVYAGKELKDATATVPFDLMSESRKSRLPRTALDIHVVKVWEQAGLSPYVEPGASVMVPELLVKDDRVPLTAGRGALTSAAAAPPAAATAATAMAPFSVRLTGDPVTTIPAGTSKQFWITVRIPKNQAPGVYSGKLVFSAPGVKPTGVPIAFEVLPMRLRMPFLQYGMDLRSRLSAEGAPAGAPVVTQDELRLQLANIRDHGFRFVSLYDPMPALADALRVYKEAGLSQVGPVVVMSPVNGKDDVEKIERLRAEIGLPPTFDIYYGTPAALLGERVASASDNFSLIRAANKRAVIVAPITSQSMLDALGQTIDVPVYNVASEYPQRLLAGGRREKNQRDWWSWNLAQEDPLRNRLYAGYLLYRTGLNSSPLYGAFPGPYQFVPGGGDPYGEKAAAAEASGAAPVLRPQMVTYPVPGGVLDTLQWEATREGVDDIRYITNLKTYIRELKDLQLAKVETEEAETFLRDAMTRPLSTLPPAELQAIRRGIADQSIKLLTVLRANAKPRYLD